MSPSDAANLLVHRYPGGAMSLAPRIGKKPNTLSHECTGTGFAKLGLNDAVLMSQVSGDPVVLHAFAEVMNCMVLPLSACEATPQELMAAIGSLSKEFSSVVATTVAADADGQITGNELAAVERCWADLLSAGQNLLSQMRARHEDGKPAHLRTGASA